MPGVWEISYWVQTRTILSGRASSPNELLVSRGFGDSLEGVVEMMRRLSNIWLNMWHTSLLSRRRFSYITVDSADQSLARERLPS